jgi:hypothetical protein
MIELLSCAWCDRPFQARRSGGRAQRFCRPSCRRAFHAAARSWALDAIASRRVTLAELKNASAATRTLPGGTMSPAPVDDDAPPQAAPHAPGDDAANLLDDLGWHRGRPTPAHDGVPRVRKQG